MSINTERSTTAQVEGQIATPYTIPRVNLIPPEVFERRAVRKVQLGVGGAALACLAVVAGGYFLAAHDAGNAENDLAAEQATATRLSAEQERYAEVPKTIALVQQAQAARDAALAQNIQWATVVGQLAAVHPGSTWLKTVDVTTTGTGGTTSTPATVTTGPAPAATLSFTGSAKDYRSVAAWLDSLKRIPNLTSPKMQTATLVSRAGQTVVDFASTAGLDAGAYTKPAERTGD